MPGLLSIWVTALSALFAVLLLLYVGAGFILPKFMYELDRLSAQMEMAPDWLQLYWQYREFLKYLVNATGIVLVISIFIYVLTQSSRREEVVVYG